MNYSVISPCLQCSWRLPGVSCSARSRARCSKFLSYIQKLSKLRAHQVLIGELKQLISK
jgi:hypothetical protein